MRYLADHVYLRGNQAVSQLWVRPDFADELVRRRRRTWSSRAQRTYWLTRQQCTGHRFGTERQALGPRPFDLYARSRSAIIVFRGVSLAPLSTSSTTISLKKIKIVHKSDFFLKFY